MRPPRKNSSPILASLLCVAAACTVAGRAQAPGQWEAIRASRVGPILPGIDLVTVYSRYEGGVRRSDRERVWVGGYKGYVAYTSDGGETWDEQQLETDESVNHIVFRDDDEGYLLAGRDIYSSEDEGHEWKLLYRVPRLPLPRGQAEATPKLFGADFMGRKEGCVVGAYSIREGAKDRLYRGLIVCTKDRGKSWQLPPVPAQTQLLGVDFGDGHNGCAVGSKGVILCTEDGGKNWKQKASHTSLTLFRIKFVSARTGWAVGENSIILYTSSGGDSWEKVECNACASARRPVLRDVGVWDGMVWVVGHGGHIFYSQDDGVNWSPKRSGGPEHLKALSLGDHNKKHGWAVGDKGKILKYDPK